jgi:hypothetical protein
MFQLIKLYLCIILLLGIGSAYGQVISTEYSHEYSKSITNRLAEEKKIKSNLYSNIFKFEKAIAIGKTENEAKESFKSRLFRIDQSGRTLVSLKINTQDKSVLSSIEKKIKESNGSVIDLNPSNSSVTDIKCWLPITEIKKIAKVNEIVSIRTPAPINFRITSAGDEQLKAEDVRTTFGVNGEWYNSTNKNKIGVISDGVSNLNTVQLYDELPTVNVLNMGNIWGDEGTAMLEIVHDIAPGSELYFYGIEYTADLNNWFLAISSLQNAGCNIIVDDLYSIEEPFFSEESVIGTAIREFINSGGVYVTACGNDAKYLLNGYTNIQNNYNIFDGNDYLTIQVPANRQQLVLQWKDSWINPEINLDLEIYNSQDTLILQSNDIQSPFFPPLEFVELDAGTYKIKIKSVSGASNNIEFKLFGNQ